MLAGAVHMGILGELKLRALQALVGKAQATGASLDLLVHAHGKGMCGIHNAFYALLYDQVRKTLRV
jgi:ATP-dependent Clp protease adapter protein ClpS